MLDDKCRLHLAVVSVFATVVARLLPPRGLQSPVSTPIITQPRFSQGAGMPVADAGGMGATVPASVIAGLCFSRLFGVARPGLRIPKKILTASI